ncbi:hypothetical protein [Oceanirhabdus seepicola]|nr:hypothetical protein [Oceanirhabdus seepicola]
MKVVAWLKEVVCWFVKEGIPAPVRFRVTTNYEIETCKWMLFKI